MQRSRLAGIAFIIMICMTACGSDKNAEVKNTENTYAEVHNTGQSDNFKPVKDSNTQDKKTAAGDIVENLDEIEKENNFGEGVNINQMMAEEYKPYADEETTLQNIDIPRVDDVEGINIDADVYNKVQMEISGILEKQNYNEAEVRIEEINVNGKYITYIVKCDDTYYHVTIRLDDYTITTMDDSLGIGQEVWEEAENNNYE